MALTAAAVQFVTPEQVRDPDLNNCPCINDDEPDEDTLDMIIDEVSDTTAIIGGFTITGRRQIIARPHRIDWGYSERGYTGRFGYSTFFACPCCGLDGIPLGDRNPVVDSVKINGTTLASSSYELHSTLVGKSLVRLDPAHPGGHPQHWPSSQRRWLADTEDHTFSVTYTEGLDTDRILVRDAVLEQICDIVTSSSRRKNQIQGATGVTMGNVSITLEDRATRVARIMAGEIGPATTRMMGILAPAGRQPSTVWAPELQDGWELNAEFVVAP